MTRYDPFAYGEVRLDPDQQQQRGAAPVEPDDMLFADGEDVKQAPPADSSWALLDEDVDGLLPGSSPDMHEAVEFGAEILGEADVDLLPPSAAPPVQARPAPRPKPAPAEPRGAVAAEPTSTSAPRQRPKVKRQPLHRPIAAPAADVHAVARTPKPRPAVPGRRGRPMAAAMLPIAICAGGGTAASWFWVMQSNPVMAGILGAATLVSGLFAWLLLRG